MAITVSGTATASNAPGGAFIDITTNFTFVKDDVIVAWININGSTPNQSVPEIGVDGTDETWAEDIDAKLESTRSHCQFVGSVIITKATPTESATYRFDHASERGGGVITQFAGVEVGSGDAGKWDIAPHISTYFLGSSTTDATPPYASLTAATDAMAVVVIARDGGLTAAPTIGNSYTNVISSHVSNGQNAAMASKQMPSGGATGTGDWTYAGSDDYAGIVFSLAAAAGAASGSAPRKGFKNTRKFNHMVTR